MAKREAYAQPPLPPGYAHVAPLGQMADRTFSVWINCMANVHRVDKLNENVLFVYKLHFSSNFCHFEMHFQVFCLIFFIFSFILSIFPMAKGGGGAYAHPLCTPMPNCKRNVPRVTNFWKKHRALTKQCALTKHRW